MIKRNWLVVNFTWKENSAYLCTKEEVVPILHEENVYSVKQILELDTCVVQTTRENIKKRNVKSFHSLRKKVGFFC